MAPPFPPPVLLARTQHAQGEITVGDAATVRLEPGLLAFLSSARDASGVPPGRGTHPMSGVPLGIAVEAAITAASGKEGGPDVLRACECVWESPIRPDEAVLAASEVAAVGERHVEARVEVRSARDDRLLLQGRVILVRVGPGGRAQALAGLLRKPT